MYWGVNGGVVGDRRTTFPASIFLAFGRGGCVWRWVAFSEGSPWSWSVVRFVVSLPELSGDLECVRWLSGASVFVEMRRGWCVGDRGLW